jgi:opacity protein-like surface antigen
MKHIISIASIAAAALTEPASAADLGRDLVDTHAYRPALSWAGFYAGGQVGATLEDELLFPTPGQRLIVGFAIEETLMAGVHAGYNWQTPAGWVYGLEADLSIIDDELVADLGIFELTDYLATIRSRIGIATGGGLLYATAGAAFIAYNDEIGDQIGDTALGFVAGAGFERKFGRHFSLGLEGLYYSLANEFNEGGDEVDTDRDFWTLRVRASYHLDLETAEALK